MDGDEGGGGRIHGGQLLEHQGGIEAGQAEAAVLFGGVQAAEAQRTGSGDGLARESVFGIPLGGVGSEFAGGKVAGGSDELLLVVGQIEIHGACLLGRAPARALPGRVACIRLVRGADSSVSWQAGAAGENPGDAALRRNLQRRAPGKQQAARACSCLTSG